MSTLSPAEKIRYSRQISLPELGETGQLRLKNARVLIVGAGGLGCPAALYLAAAGVGSLGLIDPDQVQLSNLQRQILYTPQDLGKFKTEQAQSHLNALNPEIEVFSYPEALGPENISQRLEDWDLVIDGTDQLPLRYLLNAACREAQIPWIYGSVYRFDGQVACFHPAGPCYRCVFPELPDIGSIPDCNQGGILGVLPGIIGQFQALEALKYLLWPERPPKPELLLWNGMNLELEKIQLSQDPECPGCGPEPAPLKSLKQLCQPVSEIQTSELEAWLKAHPQARLCDLRPSPGDALPAQLSGAEWLDLSAPTTWPTPKSQELLLFCQRGIRSRQAAQILRNVGYLQTVSLSGGLEALKTSFKETNT
ncbi:molybdenum cofactor biosynthesis protein MoeB [bacterium (Candidatus Blackallbacteria) CG17_big_fil_post_rev_8_21_14_2_50_48_46]|uniref:Molybdenum cofactor biosynthesis protein MoeB n=1 Tax=bacterium (Candidatus Blackallbacteria) CG17_big_fil_post_rev_8_21_14_2_50_48_46 TaxID=2014261 RepID=A0A2M7G0Q5_9BACT|nr:MAG: molybdenum cofactor biosynthesis protein MoeB [bacterium (Candidatus Blackallbacteria) CG18_big_fil_WC_8_21_14_2_50_49_26]PIW15065.1 MAG: molybdenum cofactor biosynthesis protein MoeB [bacterium (Candidatus Blackallbacteria) CG17_big_fil_post_rev_8_21_14_2_50_48_46]PIW47612.1 MAG: molybdenum cofactor biosynthesis protein MoeB [bacterium (Candidatus Blackallbacteria) CG13_big_fil_rev_8_21_14_2_50_49_14]